MPKIYEYFVRKCKEDNLTKNGVVYCENKNNGAQLHLVGTNHTNIVSANLVQNVIKENQSKYVMLELDEKRFDSFVISKPRYEYLKQIVQHMDLNKPLKSNFEDLVDWKVSYCYKFFMKNRMGIVCGKRLKLLLKRV